MSEPESDVTREQFFKWLHECPGDWAIVTDQAGESTVRFYYDEDEEDS
jgi:hypothetical protein